MIVDDIVNKFSKEEMKIKVNEMFLPLIETETFILSEYPQLEIWRPLCINYYDKDRNYIHLLALKLKLKLKEKK